MTSSPMPLRTLGKNGPSVPALGLGLMSLSHTLYGSLPGDEERFALLDRAVDLGATFWDTADLYGDGEELIGKWFKRTGKRNQIFLATKFGYVKGTGAFQTIDSSAEYCQKACEQSLKALGVDSIDLYYAHNVNKETPIEETMRALAELKSQGKIKHIGLSMISSGTLRRAVKIAPVVAVQVGYSLFTRDVEGDPGTHILAAARELGVATVAATPLDRGLISAAFADDAGLAKDFRHQAMPRFSDANVHQNVKAVRNVCEIAEKKGCTVSQLCLAWLLKQGDDVIPIPGTKKIKYLEENWASLNVSLSDAEEAEIRAVADSGQLAGGHTPEAYLAYLFQDTKPESE